ncbi:MAG TPA: hypothetical protein GX707_03750 [Epulopiscium sp.]|nr:hypothetical protein [Candidatus Epulonipiscium sp.]
MGKVIYTNYNSKEFERKEILDLNELALSDDSNIKWLDITSLDNLNIVKEVGAKFNLHPLVIEDIVNNDHMPKLDDYDNYLVLIIRAMHLNKDRKLETEQFSFVLFKDMVISFQQAESDDLIGLLKG